MLDKEGMEEDEAVNLLVSIVEEANLIVAHNVAFDKKLIQTLLWRGANNHKNLGLFNSLPTYCTMVKSTTLCGLKKRDGSLKWPKLQELHKFLFGAEFENAHDAISDIRATRDCYYELKRRGL
jgi:DNA polymerase-3 subunit alpha/DNA polymerase-3 subunit epsilon